MAFPDVIVSVEVASLQMIFLCAELLGKPGIVGPVDALDD